MARQGTRRPWALVLAGGEGRRLSSLTSALYGREVPKQFAVLDGTLSLLQRTIERIAPLFPAERVVVVVGRTHEPLAREQLADLPGLEIAAQPRNLDTAAGVLFGLARIVARDRDASIAVLPSDHFVPRPKPLLEALEEGLVAVGRGFPGAVLLGVPAVRVETGYGWIVPGETMDTAGASGLRSVSRFVEKPEPEHARRLLAHGSLWNTLITVGGAAAFWRLAHGHLPGLAKDFEAYAAAVGGPDEEEVLRAIYARNEPANFSKALLARAAGLGVMAVEGSGWSDWGSPERVFCSLEGTPELAALLERGAGVALPSGARLAGAL